MKMKSQIGQENDSLGSFYFAGRLRMIFQIGAKDSLCFKLSFGPIFTGNNPQELQNEGKRDYHSRSFFHGRFLSIRQSGAHPHPLALSSVEHIVK